jgi:hypothetical protein
MLPPQPAGLDREMALRVLEQLRRLLREKEQREQG